MRTLIWEYIGKWVHRFVFYHSKFAYEKFYTDHFNYKILKIKDYCHIRLRLSRKVYFVGKGGFKNCAPPSKGITFSWCTKRQPYIKWIAICLSVPSKVISDKNECHTWFHEKSMTIRNRSNRLFRRYKRKPLLTDFTCCFLLNCMYFCAQCASATMLWCLCS